MNDPLPVALNLDEIERDLAMERPTNNCGCVRPGCATCFNDSAHFRAWRKVQERIVAAVPDLVAEVRRLQAENEQVRAERDTAQALAHDRARRVVQLQAVVAGFGGITPEQAHRAIAAVAAVKAIHRKINLYEPCPEVNGCEHPYCGEGEYSGEFWHEDVIEAEACSECRDEDGDFVDWPCPSRAALAADEEAT